MEHLFDSEEFNYRYIIGIDLGTTNSAVSYVDLREDIEDSTRRAIHFFDIPQLIAQAEMGRRTMLPSFLYLPGEYDLPPGSLALPWNSERKYAVGEFAREQGARVSARQVASAKSWLCHAGVDRTADILPWGAPDGVDKVSPVEASTRYLQHVCEAWNAYMVDVDEDDWEEDLFEAQLIILTVPASFDEVSRELTLTAAHQAGIPRVILLEEPLAAFYAWLSEHESDWQERMRDKQLILVCDVGGGTTDFSLVGISESAGGLRFNRLAVGDHLMLGGDNMDLTLGRHIETKLMGQPGKLDPQRWHQLVHQCRKAKEVLLSAPDEQTSVDITVMGEAGKLIGGTLKDKLTQEEIRRLILDGFFPEVSVDESPGESRRTGLTELGLPYVQDPAITRHLALFWQRFQDYLEQELDRTDLYPDFLLFNGGTLIPGTLRRRLRSVIQQWFRPVAGDSWAPIELRNPHPELAVAMGAAYYGLVRLGTGVRIGSGSPRTYYVGVDAGHGEFTQGLHTAVCVAPRGIEEGYEVTLKDPDFTALTNQPVSFQIFSSSTRLGDQLGDVVQLPPDEVTQLPPIRTVLRYGRRGTVKQLPVQLAVRLTEIGTLELWCQSQQSEHRWQLQFDVRQEAESPAPSESLEETVDLALIEAAQREIEQTFQDRSQLKEYPPERLRKKLEEILGLPKEKWPTPLIRKLADTLLEIAKGRAFSPQHEAYWLNLLGFCLRPGFGDPADEWRMKQVWKLYLEGLHFANKAQSRSEWWIFWRRVAGGLKAGHQLQIYDQVRPLLQATATSNQVQRSSKKKSKRKKSNKGSAKRLGSGETLEVWMALANFEWLPAEHKVQLGRQLLRQQGRSQPKSQELWALSRFGARTTIYGPLDRLISSAEAASWLNTLLSLNLEPTDSVAHALIHIARYTGDRARDIPEAERERVSQWLDQLSRAAHFQSLLSDPESSLQREEQDWIFGESLPAGLVIVSTE